MRKISDMSYVMSKDLKPKKTGDSTLSGVNRHHRVSNQNIASSSSKYQEKLYWDSQTFDQLTENITSKTGCARFVTILKLNPNTVLFFRMGYQAS